MESTYKYSKEEVIDILNELYDEIPEYVYKNLNLGVILGDEVKYSPESKPERPLFILGEYKVNSMGRQVVIYYGSFMKTFGYLDREALKNRLRETFRHELTHHMESQGHEMDLEREDFYQIMEYKLGKATE